MNPDTHAAPNFPWSELACKGPDKTPVPEKLKPNARAVTARAQIFRTFGGVPFTVKSAYRTEAWNAKQEGAAKESQHLTASALDLQDKRKHGFTGPQLAELYEGLIRLGLVPDGGVGIYNTFVHIDIGPPRRWWPGKAAGKPRPVAVWK